MKTVCGMKLLIDVGNTRIKWCLLAATDAIDQAHVIKGSEEDLSQFLEALDCSNVGVWYAAVNSVSSLESVLSRYSFASMVQALTLKEQHGLRNSYAYPQRMGVDRWLVMQAAWKHAQQEDIIVIDAGTAITIDVVLSMGPGLGEHKGGYILPGLHMAMQALYSTTGQVRSYDEEAKGLADKALGTSTDQCVEYGVLNQVLALVRQVSASYPGAGVYLTGGDGEQLFQYLVTEVDMSVNLDENLVLKGFGIGEIAYALGIFNIIVS